MAAAWYSSAVAAVPQAVLHYGEAIKAIMNEELGDGWNPLPLSSRFSLAYSAELTACAMGAANPVPSSWIRVFEGKYNLLYRVCCCATGMSALESRSRSWSFALTEGHKRDWPPHTT